MKEPQWPGVVHHIDRGEKIQAIKVYREQTGVPLKEAKETVEAMARQRGLSSTLWS